MRFYIRYPLRLAILFMLVMLSGCFSSERKPLNRQLHALDGEYAANISDDAHYAIVSSIHNGISLWDLTKDARKYTWYQQQNNSDNLVLAAVIANDNKYALTASRFNFALWNISTGHNDGYWKVRNSNIRDIALSNDGQYILIGKSNGVVVHITLATGRRLEFLGHKEKVNSVAMLPNGRVAMSGGNDFVALVWDTKSGQVIYRFNHPSRVTKVALDPLGRYAFSADSKKMAVIWDLRTGKKISALHYINRQEVFTSVKFSADGKQLLTGAPSSKVSIWDIATGKRVDTWRVTSKDNFRPSGSVVYSAAFTNNNTVITESSAGYAETWPIKP